MQNRFFKISILFSFFMFATPGYAFIGIPSLALYSPKMVIDNPILFVTFFMILVIFQGWYISNRHNDIGLKEAVMSTFGYKLFFLFYVIPVLLLGDIFGFSAFWLLRKISLFEYFNDNLAGIIFFSFYLFVSVILIIYVVTKIESYLSIKKYPNINPNHLRHSLMLSNIILSVCVVIIITFNIVYIK
ncbi:MAG: hypothetical protein JXQ68_04885 [Campylobacterales bacterium]|nr:hypothetical protein [Campylobacterales bacterium]